MSLRQDLRQQLDLVAKGGSTAVVDALQRVLSTEERRLLGAALEDCGESYERSVSAAG